MVYNLQNHLFLSSHTPLEQQTLINSASRTCHLYMYSFVYVLTLPIYGPWSLIGHDDGFCIQTCQTLKARFLHPPYHIALIIFGVCVHRFLPLYENFMGSSMKTLWLFLCVESHSLSCRKNIDNSNN